MKNVITIEEDKLLMLINIAVAADNISIFKDNISRKNPALIKYAKIDKLSYALKMYNKYYGIT